MNRKAIRDLAAKELVKTATTVMPLQLTNLGVEVGMPCKTLMF
jgi:hypothetical protein